MAPHLLKESHQRRVINCEAFSLIELTHGMIHSDNLPNLVVNDVIAIAWYHQYFRKYPQAKTVENMSSSKLVFSKLLEVTKQSHKVERHYWEESRHCNRQKPKIVTIFRSSEIPHNVDKSTLLHSDELNLVSRERHVNCELLLQVEWLE